MGDFDFGGFDFGEVEDPFKTSFQTDFSTPQLNPNAGLSGQDFTDDFMTSYGQLLNNNPTPESYYDPNSNAMQEYMAAASAPSEAEKMLSEYASSRPKEDEFKPGLWRTIGGALLGMAANLGNTMAGRAGGPQMAGEIASTIFNDPYNRAMERWKGEGVGITQRAKELSSKEGRRLGALRYGVSSEIAGKKGAAIEGFRREQEARRIAAAIDKEKADNDRIDAQHKQTEFMNEYRLDRAHEQKDMDEWRKAEAVRDNTARDEARKSREESKAASAQSLDAINKKLGAYASQQGIDTTKMTALDVAKSIAFQRAKANPAFGDLIEQDEGGNWTVNTPKEGADRERILRIYIDNLTKKLLKGEF